MRKKQEILEMVDILLGEDADNKKLALMTAYQFLEVLIDIRDIHSQALVALDRIGESLEVLK